MSITYIPREKDWSERLQEGISPYLQMAMEYMLKKKMAEQERKLPMPPAEAEKMEKQFEYDKQLAQIKGEQGLSGYMVDESGRAVPVFRGMGSTSPQVPQPTIPNTQRLNTPPIPQNIQDNVLGQQQMGSFQPESFKDPFGMQYKYKPSEAEQLKGLVTAGRGKGIEEGFKQAEGQKRAFKKLGSISRQFTEALPSGDKTAVEQRINGFMSTIGAKTGFQPNPQLMALQNTAKLQLRAILRDMGEGARLSDQDITQNIALIEQAGLTDDERKAQVRSFMQTAVDSMDSDTLKILQDDPNTIELLKGFGVSLTQGGKGGVLSTGMNYKVEK